MCVCVKEVISMCVCKKSAAHTRPAHKCPTNPKKHLHSCVWYESRIPYIFVRNLLLLRIHVSHKLFICVYVCQIQCRCFSLFVGLSCAADSCAFMCHTSYSSVYMYVRRWITHLCIRKKSAAHESPTNKGKHLHSCVWHESYICVCVRNLVLVCIHV